MQLDDQRERLIDDYLFDPGAPPQDAIAELERSLESLRYPLERRPLSLPPRVAPQRRRWPLGVIVAAAAALVVLAIGLRFWIWSWPDGRPWRVDVGPVERSQSLREGERLEVAPGGVATVHIARIGRMLVAPGSEVRLVATHGIRHRLAVEHGSLSIAVWAPPFSVSIETPAGRVADMGCAFDLTVDQEVTAVQVRSGWVQLENGGGEVLVPAGAESRMSPDRSAAVPVFSDAARSFKEAVHRIEEGAADGADLEAIRSTLRRRDVYTILMLAQRTPFARDQLLDRAGELAPPPSREVREQAGRGEAEAVWRWVETLDLPPPKGWIRNFRDAWPGVIGASDWLTGGARRPAGPDAR